jgi:hypothetical protein
MAKGRVFHVVQTFKHAREDDLKHNLSMLALARTKMHAAREYKDFCQLYGFVGTIRTLEVTHSDKNGWHPHIHQLILTRSSWPISRFLRFKASYMRMWRKYASRAGLVSYDDACTFDLVSDERESLRRMSDYVSGDTGFLTDEELIEMDNQISNLDRREKNNSTSTAKEMTFQAVKMAKNESRSPMQLLRDFAISGCVYSGVLFHEYLDAFDGKRQVLWSNGLKKKFGIKDFNDKELAEKAPVDEILLGILNKAEWSAVLANSRARGEILKIAESSEWSDVQEFVEVLYLRYVDNAYNAKGEPSTVTGHVFPFNI